MKCRTESVSEEVTITQVVQLAVITLNKEEATILCDIFYRHITGGGAARKLIDDLDDKLERIFGDDVRRTEYWERKPLSLDARDKPKTVTLPGD